MLTSVLDYDLPPELIAQHPVVPRDSSRLLVHDRGRCATSHGRMPELLSFLDPADILVYNDSRVIRARVQVSKPTGGRVELLFLRRHGERLWEVLARPSSRLSEGMELSLAPVHREAFSAAGKAFVLRQNLGSGRWMLKNVSGFSTEELLERAGEMPLPPYIHERLKEPQDYQTVYAASPGSAAAPTAGLHFTGRLIGLIREAGIGMAPLTLHIGLDTFRPVSADDLALHQIHKEAYQLPDSSHKAITAARERGGRVVAVGTTTVRVLETIYGIPGAALSGETGLFITPGYRFTVVDAMLTNFHLPRSTLLALVMAFAGVDEVKRLYQEAIRERYRFYSFGDAMLLL